MLLRLVKGKLAQLKNKTDTALTFLPGKGIWSSQRIQERIISWDSETQVVNLHSLSVGNYIPNRLGM